jgi:hypothetical protein
MSYLYKLTDEFGNTRDQTHWAEGTKHEIAKELRDSTQPLCTRHYYHAYENPLVAVFMNPVHANFRNSILWRATGWVSKRDGQLKCGCFTLRTLQQIPLPVLTTNQRVRVSIQCTLKRSQTESFKLWAKNWLSGIDRAADAANAAYAANATYAAYAACAAADAANAACAAHATYAAYAANAACAAHAANATNAACAAYAANAANAACAAANAAHAAIAANVAPFNLIAVIKRALREEPANS